MVAGTNYKTSEESIRATIDGTEIVRLATSGANWKATLQSIFSQLGTSSYTAQNPLVVVGTTQLDYVAASSVNHQLGPTDVAGDYLYGVLAVPEGTSPGSITIKDGGAGTVWELFNGGTGSIASKVPFFIPVNTIALAGAWRITVGAGIHCLVQGTFT